jgi:hypothetical protein
MLVDKRKAQLIAGTGVKSPLSDPQASILFGGLKMLHLFKERVYHLPRSCSSFMPSNNQPPTKRFHQISSRSASSQ